MADVTLTYKGNTILELDDYETYHIWSSYNIVAGPDVN